MKVLFEKLIALGLSALTVVALVYLTFSEHDRRLQVMNSLTMMQEHVANDQVFSAILCYRVQAMEQASQRPAHLDCPNLLRHMLDGELIKPNGAVP